MSQNCATVDGLPAIEPTLDWVRLSQRFPVRVILEERDPDHPFRMGATAVVTVQGFRIVDPPLPCRRGAQRASGSSLAAPRPSPAISPKELARHPRRLAQAVRLALLASIGNGVMTAAHVTSVLGPYLLWAVAAAPRPMMRPCEVEPLRRIAQSVDPLSGRADARGKSRSGGGRRADKPGGGLWNESGAGFIGSGPGRRRQRPVCCAAACWRDHRAAV